MTNLESLVVTLSLKAEQLMQGLHRAEEGLKKLGEEAKEAQEKIREMSEKSASFTDALKEHIVGLMGALASVGAFMAFTEHTVKAQVATGRLADEAHMSVVELGALQIAADKMGGSAEGVNRSITMMGEKLSVLGTKMRGAKMAGMALGMAMGYQGKEAEAAGVKMFKGKQPLEAMMMMADKMHEKGDFFSAKKLGAMAGITDEGLIRNMMKGKEAFAEYIEEQKKYAATDEDIRHSMEFEETQKDLKFSMEKVAMTIMQFVMPALKKLAHAFLELSEWARNNPKKIEAALTALGVVMVLLSAHAIRMGWNMVVAWVASGYEAIKAGIKFIWAGDAGVAGALATAGAWIKAGGSFAVAAAQAMAAGIKMHIAWLVGLGPIGLIIAAVEILIGVFVALYMMFPRIREAAKTVFTFISDFIRLKITNAIAVFEALWEVIKNIFEMVVALVLLDTDKIGDAWEKLTTSLGRLWSAMWYGIRNELVVASFEILETMDAMWQKLKNVPMFKVIAKMHGIDTSEADALHGYVEEINRRADVMSGHAQSPAVANSSTNKWSSAHMHIDNIDVVAPDGTNNPIEWAEKIAHAINPFTQLLGHAEGIK